ncbi:hypothetical protein M8J76_013220 [Diaphorina citri]|nr:hypothetical protein M8J76_013220 [Diaphorina citri]
MKNSTTLSKQIDLEYPHSILKGQSKIFRTGNFGDTHFVPKTSSRLNYTEDFRKRQSNVSDFRKVADIGLAKYRYDNRLHTVDNRKQCETENSNNVSDFRKVADIGLAKYRYDNRLHTVDNRKQCETENYRTPFTCTKDTSLYNFASNYKGYNYLTPNVLGLMKAKLPQHQTLVQKYMDDNLTKDVQNSRYKSNLKLPELQLRSIHNGEGRNRQSTMKDFHFKKPTLTFTLDKDQCFNKEDPSTTLPRMLNDVKYPLPSEKMPLKLPNLKFSPESSIMIANAVERDDLKRNNVCPPFTPKVNYLTDKVNNVKDITHFLEKDSRGYINVSKLLHELQANKCKMEENTMNKTQFQVINPSKTKMINVSKTNNVDATRCSTQSYDRYVFKTTDTSHLPNEEVKEIEERSNLPTVEEKRDVLPELREPRLQKRQEVEKDKKENDTGKTGEVLSKDENKINRGKIKHKRSQKKYLMDKYLNSVKLPVKNHENEAISQKKTENNTIVNHRDETNHDKKDIHDKHDEEKLTINDEKCNNNNNEQNNETSHDAKTGDSNALISKISKHSGLRKKSDHLNLNLTKPRVSMVTLQQEDSFKSTMSGVFVKSANAESDIKGHSNDLSSQKKISNHKICNKSNDVKGPEQKPLESEDEFFDCAATLLEENISKEKNECKVKDVLTIKSGHNDVKKTSEQNSLRGTEGKETSVLTTSVENVSTFVTSKLNHVLNDLSALLNQHKNIHFHAERDNICKKEVSTMISNWEMNRMNSEEDALNSYNSINNASENSNDSNEKAIDKQEVDSLNEPTDLKEGDSKKKADTVARSVETQTENEIENSDINSIKSSIKDEKIEKIPENTLRTKDIGIETSHIKSSAKSSYKIILEVNNNEGKIVGKEERTSPRRKFNQMNQRKCKVIRKISSDRTLINEDYPENQSEEIIKEKTSFYDSRNIYIDEESVCSSYHKGNITNLYVSESHVERLQGHCSCSHCNVSTQWSSTTICEYERNEIEIGDRQSTDTLRIQSADTFSKCSCDEEPQKNDLHMVKSHLYDRYSYEEPSKNDIHIVKSRFYNGNKKRDINQRRSTIHGSNRIEKRRPAQKCLQKVRKIGSKNVRWIRKENRNEMDEIDIALSYSSLSQEDMHVKCDSDYLQLKGAKKWYHFCFKP